MNNLVLWTIHTYSNLTFSKAFDTVDHCILLDKLIFVVSMALQLVGFTTISQIGNNRWIIMAIGLVSKRRNVAFNKGRIWWSGAQTWGKFRHDLFNDSTGIEILKSFAAWLPTTPCNDDVFGKSTSQAHTSQNWGHRHNPITTTLIMVLKYSSPFFQSILSKLF